MSSSSDFTFVFGARFFATTLLPLAFPCFGVAGSSSDSSFKLFDTSFLVLRLILMFGAATSSSTGAWPPTSSTCLPLFALCLVVGFLSSPFAVSSSASTFLLLLAAVFAFFGEGASATSSSSSPAAFLVRVRFFGPGFVGVCCASLFSALD